MKTQRINFPLCYASYSTEGQSRVLRTLNRPLCTKPDAPALHS